MKNYETLEIKVIMLLKNDIVQTSSEYDNVGGIPDTWQGNE